MPRDRRQVRTFLLALAVLFTSAYADQSIGDDQQVNVEGGQVRGAGADGVISFKGIPFAAPPVGALRWRAPQPVAPWEGVLKASAFGNDCMQPSEALGATSTGISEDCLYLNVWRPAEGDRPLPVFVWIYGGGLTRGGASLFSGEYLARKGLVVVTFNYRVGRLGFFGHPALGREAAGEPVGNFGYMDQIAALEWVRRNIAAFGGDPGNVAIAGESAGGGSVLVMLTSPGARGLFHRAILQSPGLPTARAAVLPLRSPGEAGVIAVDYARELGIGGDEETQLAGLRALPAARLSEGVEGYLEALFGGPDVPGLTYAIRDGTIVVEAPEEALRGGRQAPVPVIVGANDRDLAISPARTKDELFALFGLLGAQARALYDPGGEASLDDLVQAIVADRTMLEPARHLAELVSAGGQPAYLYRFSYVPEIRRGVVPGARHGAEIPFAFDASADMLGDKTSASDIATAEAMSGYWTAFAKTGDPNGGGRPAWPPFDPASGMVLDFTNEGIAHVADPLKARLDLWREAWTLREPKACCNCTADRECRP